MNVPTPRADFISPRQEGALIDALDGLVYRSKKGWYAPGKSRVFPTLTIQDLEKKGLLAATWAPLPDRKAVLTEVGRLKREEILAEKASGRKSING